MPRFVTVHRSLDPIAAEIARDLLADAGIAARMTGGGAAAVGLSPTLVEVPEAWRDHAERLLSEHAAELALPTADVATADDDERGPRPLRAVLAAGVTPVCPGGGHFYARRRIVGASILAAQIAALIICIVGDSRAVTAAALCAAGLFVFDLIGSQLAVRAENRGRHPSSARQAATGAVVVALVGGAAALVAPHLDRLHLARRGTGGARDDAERWRARSTRPADLPFPLHLDLNR